MQKENTREETRS